MLYCSLIFAHYRRMPVALAILTDKRPASETPGVFESAQYGTKLLYNYNIFEVYNHSEEELLNSDNPLDCFVYAARDYDVYRKDENLKYRYQLKIARNLAARGYNEIERDYIFNFVTRIVNLRDRDLRNEFFDELRRMKGEDKVAELTWIEEHYINESIERGRNEGIAEGRAEGRHETMSAAIDFMRSNGMTEAQIEKFRSSVM